MSVLCGHVRDQGFSLRILDGMRGNDAMVQDGLRRLGADQAEMAASRDRTGRILLPAGHFETAVALLGPPLTSEAIEQPPSDSGLGPPLQRLGHRATLGARTTPREVSVSGPARRLTSLALIPSRGARVGEDLAEVVGDRAERATPAEDEVVAE